MIKKLWNRNLRLRLISIISTKAIPALKQLNRSQFSINRGNLLQFLNAENVNNKVSPRLMLKENLTGPMAERPPKDLKSDRRWHLVWWIRCIWVRRLRGVQLIRIISQFKVWFKTLIYTITVRAHRIWNQWLIGTNSTAWTMVVRAFQISDQQRPLIWTNIKMLHRMSICILSISLPAAGQARHPWITEWCRRGSKLRSGSRCIHPIWAKWSPHPKSRKWKSQPLLMVELGIIGTRQEEVAYFHRSMGISE